MKANSIENCFVLWQGQKKVVLRKGFFCSPWLGKIVFFSTNHLDPGVLKEDFWEFMGCESEVFILFSRRYGISKRVKNTKGSLLLKFYRSYVQMWSP